VRADYLVPASPRSQRRVRGALTRLIALDSDGTVFDSMRPKHLEAFLPAFAESFVPSHPEAAEAVWRFVNLESRSRGVNRYRALSQCLRLLPGHPSVQKVDPAWKRVASSVDAWLAAEPSPSRPALEKAALGDPILSSVLDWSVAVDRMVASMPPARAFEGALRAIPFLAGLGEVMVLTGAPEAAVKREWTDAGILGYTSEVAGQERGPKSALLAGKACCLPGGGRVLVVGDAMGDLDAARGSGAAFFPVIPGREEACWEELADRGLERFIAGERSPSDRLLGDFLAALPATPPWKKA